MRHLDEWSFELVHVKGLLAGAALTLALAPPVAAATPVSDVTGKLVDVATYVTHDHNMDSMHVMAGDHSMKGDSMKGDSMKGDSMKGDHMMSDVSAKEHAAVCPALGVVTDAGRVYLVATQMGQALGADLCRHINSTVTLSGRIFAQGGTSVFLVKAIK